MWIDEQYLALQFACFNCLAKDGGDTLPSDGVGRGGAEPGAPAPLQEAGMISYRCSPPSRPMR